MVSLAYLSDASNQTNFSISSLKMLLLDAHTSLDRTPFPETISNYPKKLSAIASSCRNYSAAETHCQDLQTDCFHEKSGILIDHSFSQCWIRDCFVHLCSHSDARCVLWLSQIVIHLVSVSYLGSRTIL